MMSGSHARFYKVRVNEIVIMKQQNIASSRLLDTEVEIIVGPNVVIVSEIPDA